MDKYHGQGKFSFPNGDSYEVIYSEQGLWQYNFECGLARFDKKDGNRYIVFLSIQAEFKYGVIHGKGTHFVPNGDKYEGGFKNGLHHGFGIFMSASGNIYHVIAFRRAPLSSASVKAPAP